MDQEKIDHLRHELRHGNDFDHETCRDLLDELEAINKERQYIEINDDFIHNKYGYCYYEIEPGKNPIIFNLFVNPQYRRRGHAKWLLQYVINEIRKTGYNGEIGIEASPRENAIEKDKLSNFHFIILVCNRKPKAFIKI